MAQGTVKWFSAEEWGVGMIGVDGGTDVFVQRRDIEGEADLDEGQRVEFDVVQNRKGPQAERVRIVG